ncbi:MAG: hypothetical protein QNJ51_05780 [Calothrix sp. MO_167.B12]|nr:hypothetical protein [Calothrix sp. MO_167.B12]
MATKPRSNIRARRRQLQSNSIPSRVTKKSRKLPSRSGNHRRVLPATKSSAQKQFLPTNLLTSRQPLLGRKRANITLPGTTNRLSPRLKTDQHQVSSLPLVSPPNNTTPWWLLRLYALHRYSCLGTFLLVVAVLVVYGWTVYSQKLWGQNYRKLQELQRDERQLTKTNEVLKNKMAQEAEKPNAGLLSPTPNKTIFLPRKQLEVDRNPTVQTSPPQRQPSPSSLLGY